MLTFAVMYPNSHRSEPNMIYLSIMLPIDKYLSNHNHTNFENRMITA